MELIYGIVVCDKKKHMIMRYLKTII